MAYFRRSFPSKSRIRELSRCYAEVKDLIRGLSTRSVTDIARPPSNSCRAGVESVVSWSLTGSEMFPGSLCITFAIGLLILAISYHVVSASKGGIVSGGYLKKPSACE